MNRFVYLVHTDYLHPAPSAMVTPGGSRSRAEKLARLGAELRRYLPDMHVQISGEPIRRDPDVIRVTIVTSLDESAADSAFVRFVQGSKTTAVHE
jgi:hypothetical protein